MPVAANSHHHHHCVVLLKVSCTWVVILSVVFVIVSVAIWETNFRSASLLGRGSDVLHVEGDLINEVEVDDACFVTGSFGISGTLYKTLFFK